MTSIKNQLLKLRDGKSKLIRGLTVTRDGDEYEIEGDHYSLDRAASHITECGAKRTKGVDYSGIAFLIVKPPSRVVSTHRVRNKTEHKQLLEKAFKKQCFLYMASVEHRDGKYYAVQPWVIDWDSVNALYETDGTPKVEFKDKPKPVKKKLSKKERDAGVAAANKPSKPEKTGLYCPYCDHKINSTPGRTLHVKSKHPDKLEEYQKWLKSHGKS
jgi:hypothetical protein